MKQPNILLVMADQLAAPALPIYRRSIVKAPNIERLAESGVVFEAAYCNSPLCAPSRFSMLTGRFPSRIGAYDNAAAFRSDIPTFAHYLRAAGYQTALSGKMHFVGPDQLHGFEERLTTDIYPADFAWTPDWDNPDDRIESWYHDMLSVKQAGVAEATNQLDFDDDVGFQALRKIRDYARPSDDRPWFLTVSFTHPHDPYAMRRTYWDRYDHDAIDLPGVGPIPFEDLDEHSRRLYHLAAMSDHEIVEGDVRNARHGYYAAISYVDDWLGQLLKALDSYGVADSTIVVFTADHGDMLGERGLWYKMCFFEWAATVPLVFFAPGRFRPGRVAEPVSLVDLLPTLVELGQADRPGQRVPLGPLDGMSLVPTLEGDPKSDGEVVAEYMAEGAIAPCFMIRRGTYKYVFSEPDTPQLYDLATDPEERVNLSSAPAHSELAASFEAEVHRRWNPAGLRDEVVASQRARRLVTKALMTGEYYPWDHQPYRDASRQYMRGHLDLRNVERLGRYPLPAPTTERPSET